MHKKFYSNIAKGSEGILIGNSAHAVLTHMCEEGMGIHQAHEPSQKHCRLRDFYIASDNQSQIKVWTKFLKIGRKTLRALTQY